MHKTFPKIIILISLIALAVIFLAVQKMVSADSITNLNNNTSSSPDVSNQLKDLEQKAQTYQKIIDLKKQQQQSLTNQIEIIDAEANRLATNIEIKKQEIQNINNQISQLESQIAEKEKSMENQEKILSNLLQTYYEDRREDILYDLMEQSNASSFMFKEDRLAQTSNKVREIMSNIKSLRDNLVEEKTTLENNKTAIIDISNKLEDEKSKLDNQQQSKQDLLDQTKGEEQKYQKLLVRVEEQKQELLDVDQLSSAQGLSADKYPKPPSSSFASTNWYYSQKDPRWGDETIGNSHTTMKSYGCAVTAVAMVSTFYGSHATPLVLSGKPIYSWDLISWDMKKWSGSNIKMDNTYGYAHGNISWSVVDSEIKNSQLVIVYIKKTNGGGGHYVVIHHKTSDGKYVVHDPYFGPNIFLDTSRSLVGKMGADSGTKIDQMIIYSEK